MSADWNIQVTRRSTDDDGVLHLDATVLDGAVEQATVRLTVTPDRALKVVWSNLPDVDGLTGFEAWEQVQ